MTRLSGNSLLNTLKGKIWISTSVLAFFICTFGLISYLVVTLLTSDPFYGVFVPFIFLAFTVIVFGWWLSNEIVSPIEKLILLAKSLERNSTATLPKYTGSAETDQLLANLNRNNQQIQNVVTLMDKVANGNVDVALSPLNGSDRLTASFQKLLTKVSESIHAKDELTKLQNEIQQVKSEVSGIRKGNLNVEINSDYYYTKEITDSFKYLLENLRLMISLIKVDSHQVQHSANDLEQAIESLIQQDENKIQELNKASNTLKEVPNLIEKITDNLTDSAKSAKQTIERASLGTKISQENSESIGYLRTNLREVLNRIQGLNERSQEIDKVAKTVEDLANRTNMIALNASLRATEFGEEGRSFFLVSEELERLATRANGTNKQISTLNNSILSEIGKVESVLKTTVGGVADLSKYAIETNNILGELERYVGQYLNLQENLIAFSKDQYAETDEAFETFASSITETENNIKNLTESSSEIRKISLIMKTLQAHTSDFRITPENTENDFQQNNHNTDYSKFESVFSAKSKEDLLLKEFKSQEFSTEDFNAVKINTDEFNEMMKSDNTNSQEFNSQEFDSQEFNSQEFDSREFSSQEFNSENIDSGEYNSDTFNTDEFYAEEFQSLEPVSQTLMTKEMNSEKNGLESEDSDNLNYSEFMTDDLDIDVQMSNDAENDKSNEKSIDFENPLRDEDLLNLNLDSNQESNSNLNV